MPLESGGVGEVWSALVELVLPAPCAGCGSTRLRGPLCQACATAFAAATPRRVRPSLEPPGMPRCLALAAYAGALRGAILGYKERGRHGLAAALGDRLADVVVAGLEGVPVGAPVVLVPVPSTAAAARRRYGDHMVRLARRAAGRLDRDGRPAEVVSPLRARSTTDSAGLSGTDRALRAREAFAPVPARMAALRSAAEAGAHVVLVDDVITTGATVAGAVARLRTGGLEVAAVATLAATLRRAARPALWSGPAP